MDDALSDTLGRRTLWVLSIIYLFIVRFKMVMERVICLD